MSCCLVFFLRRVRITEEWERVWRGGVWDELWVMQVTVCVCVLSYSSYIKERCYYVSLSLSLSLSFWLAMAQCLILCPSFGEPLSPLTRSACRFWVPSWFSVLSLGLIPLRDRQMEREGQKQRRRDCVFPQISSSELPFCLLPTQTASWLK